MGPAGAVLSESVAQTMGIRGRGLIEAIETGHGHIRQHLRARGCARPPCRPTASAWHGGSGPEEHEMRRVGCREICEKGFERRAGQRIFSCHRAGIIGTGFAACRNET